MSYEPGEIAQELLAEVTQQQSTRIKCLKCGKRNDMMVLLTEFGGQCPECGHQLLAPQLTACDKE